MSPLESAAMDGAAHHHNVRVESFILEELFMLRDAGRQKDHVVAAGDRNTDLIGCGGVERADENH
ncbi:MAG TPA: hypothetical protein VFX54_20725 [Candidatus Binatia bacterium]|nr:hypothetical protein [Candidatus Binatia bacterium]